MLVGHRPLLSIAVAAFVPLLVFGALQGASVLQTRAEEARAGALGRAREVNAQIDAVVLADQASLSVLASSRSLALRDFASARERVRQVMSLRPHWRNVALIDLASRSVIWQTPREGEQAVAQDALLSSTASFSRSTVGIAEAPAGCRCVLLNAPVNFDGETRYVLSLQRDTEDFQNFLLGALGSDEVAAVVDEHGAFLARSVAFEQRLGTPATIYVRNAIAAGKSGVYDGVTYEGFRNQTAFETSALTNWSTHIAVPAMRFASLAAGSFGVTLLAGLVALGFAAVFAFVALRELRLQKLEEERRLKSQKLEAVGQFAGVVAHDFNNLLMVVLGNLRRLRPLVTEDAPTRAVDQALEAAQRGSDLVAQLLSFARNKPIEVTCVDIGKAVTGMTALLQQSVGKHVDLQVNIDEAARFGTTNPAQLELALLNLAVNARDAMPDGGVLLIETRASPGCVDLVVKDTGLGMSKEVLARASEPFFTTKSEGNGTGLGLAQAQALMARSGGSLHIASSLGEGTQIMLRFPVCTPSGDADVER